MASITIPESVTYIGEEPFSECKNLDDIYYSGNIIQWKKLLIKSKWNGKITINESEKFSPKVHYNIVENVIIIAAIAVAVVIAAAVIIVVVVLKKRKKQ